MSKLSKRIKRILILFIVFFLWQPTFRACEKESPRDSKALFAKALITRGEGNLRSAVDQLQQILMQDPTFEHAYACLADAASESGSLDSVEDFLHSMIGKFPMAAGPRIGLGWIDLKKGLGFEKTADEARKAVEKNPYSAEAYELTVLNYAYADYAKELIPLMKHYVEKYPDSVEALAGLGGALVWADEKDEALKVLKEALLKDPSTPYGLEYISEVYTIDGDAIDAVEALETKRKVHQEKGEIDKEAQSLCNLALAYCDVGTNRKAKECAEECLQICRAIGDRRSEGFCTTALGNVEWNLGDVKKSLEKHEQALSLFSGIPHWPGLALCNMGRCRMALGDYDKSLEDYSEALKHLLSLDSVVEPHTQIGNIFLERGGYQKALEKLAYALETGELTQESAKTTAVLKSLARLMRVLGEPYLARELLVHVVDQYRKMGNPQNLAEELCELADVQMETLDDLRGADSRYREALDIARCQGNKLLEADALHGLGRLAMRKGDRDTAATLLTDALRIAVSGNTRPREMQVKLSIARNLFETGRPNDSLSYANEVLTWGKEERVSDLKLKSLLLLEPIEEKLGHPEFAEKYYREAIQTMEDIRSSLLSESTRAGFMRDKYKTYEAFVLFLISIGKQEDSFEYMQRSRERAFFDFVESRNFRGRDDDDPQKGLKAIAKIESKIRKWSPEENAATNPDFFSRTYRSSPREDPLFIYRMISRVFSSYTPYRTPQVSTDPVKLREIQALLPDDVTLIEYYVTRDRLVIYVVGKNNFMVKEIPVTKEKLTFLVQSLKWGLQDKALGTGYIEPAQRLYDYLIRSIEGEIHTAKLLFIPHDVLHYIPFSVLNDGVDFLLKKRSTSCLPSAGLLKILRSGREQKAGKFLALGNPTNGNTILNYSLSEIEEIRGIFPEGIYLVNEKATESALKKIAPYCSVIHISSHSSFHEKNVYRSGFFLSPDGQEDGFLDWMDISSLDLAKAPLVTLSGCETASSVVGEGDEVVGMARGFFFAGASALVSSLWEVDDYATSKLMGRFYRFLKEGNSRADSLRLAQLKNLEAGGTLAHPYYWSPFVYIGLP